MKLFIYLAVFMTLTGCASLSQEDHDIIDEVETAQDKSAEELQEIKRLVYSCEGCVAGSASKLSIEESGLESYSLSGDLGSKLPNNLFDIPVEDNEKVHKWIRFYTKNRAGKRSFMIHAERAGQYAPIMSEIMAQKGLPRDLIYVAMAESGFRNDARSWASAMGPWQFMSFTGKKFGLKVNWDIDQRRDPFRATVAAGDYLKFLHGYFKDWRLAWSGYNAGEGKMQRAINRYKTRDFWKISRGRYLKSETKNYTPKIMALAIVGKNLEYFGFKDKDAIKFDDLIEFETITVPAKSDMFKVAELIDLDRKKLHALNPEILRWYTPATGHYKLKVPVGKKAVWDSLAVTDVKVKPNDYQTYTVKKYGTLKHMNRMYKVPLTVLEELNGYNRTKHLTAGTLIKLPFRVGQHKKAPMYADLYRKKVSRKKRGRKNKYKKLLRTGMRKGKKISNPKQFYTVKKGDSLWTVSKRTGVAMNTIIRSNHGLLKKRMIRSGDRLVIR